ncbi:hypothetical protein TREMEDRAFT_28670 [Tremella mesenterica DSM 1558]|uniref:uncharacterized protein n=1 Tax=Tremella mesenterica (strain ATCC 24925 / CBS 8224 / DSM 1558 / NBRC 9311 / NRRL Y-6157 / RJB 2259-6 / UBC 559-6) TaxID=578456 RepID=UPI0003F49E98|nr:uncharacterized protein TREMEDRAFT_28670 [Tremella mesenterica DSM 1558]EIW70705.1 hypothetical protein TREMEDRAFT_28670 [Tremella mesenterica DSM 1558]
MRSSAKITLALGPPNPSTTTSTGNGEPVKSVSIDTYTDQGWTCGVCGYSNPTDVGMGKCGLCGVPYSVSQAAMSSFSQGPSRTSTPTPRPISTMSATAPPEISQISSEITTSLEEGIPCPACTFLNHTSMTFCEICSTRLKTSTSRKANITGPDMSDPSGGRSQSKQEVVRLSFRGGGEKVAYQKLKSVLTQKAWEKSQKTRRDKENGEVKSGAGIDGIMNTLSLDAKEQEEHVKESFRDLELLMVRAGEMVRLAQSLSAKLSASSSPSESETSLIHNSLVQLGLPAPALTPDMVSTDRAYHTGLAKELAHLLLGKTGDGGLMNQVGRGVIGLDEVWGFWMRARGVALLPPSTLISVLPYLATQTSIRDLTLPSGLRVLHTKSYDPISILHRILVLLTPSAHSPSSELMEHIELLQIPESSSISVTLGDEPSRVGGTQLDSTEIKGLVRDDQAQGGVRWYRDLITPWML